MENKWISVKDRLPEPNKYGRESSPVLVVIDNDHVWIAWYDKKSKDWWDNGGLIEGVTYWMPLPEKPE